MAMRTGLKETEEECEIEREVTDTPGEGPHTDLVRNFWTSHFNISNIETTLECLPIRDCVPESLALRMFKYQNPQISDNGNCFSANFVSQSIAAGLGLKHFLHPQADGEYFFNASCIVPSQTPIEEAEHQGKWFTWSLKEWELIHCSKSGHRIFSQNMSKIPYLGICFNLLKNNQKLISCFFAILKLARFSKKFFELFI